MAPASISSSAIAAAQTPETLRDRGWDCVLLLGLEDGIVFFCGLEASAPADSKILMLPYFESLLCPHTHPCPS